MITAMLKNKHLKLLIAILLITIIVFVLFQNYQKNAIASVPNSFCVYAGDDNKKYNFSSDDWQNNNYDLQIIEVENDKKTYHINVEEQYLSADGAYVYVTGNYWDSLMKPNVFVDGQRVKVRTTGMNYYHFYIYEVIPEHKYEINVFCGKKSDYINVVFHFQ